MSGLRVAPFIAALLLVAGPAAADNSPKSVTTEYSAYEIETIKGAEKSLGATVDPNAEGKIVESIELVRLDPIEERDPAPVALNKAHVTTKEDVILHEVLLGVGRPYRAYLADETARNIRRFMHVSVVVVVPLHGSAPDRVRLVVITKDVWSLFPDVDFRVTSGGPEYLMFELKETNLLGRQVEITTRSIVQPESYSLGGAYVAPRFAGRFLSLHAEANVILNRRSGDPEGSYGDTKVESPLFSTRTSWAWGLGFAWRDEIYRRYTNAAVAQYDDTLPWVYRSRRIEEGFYATRSFGWARKHDISLGASIVRDEYLVPNIADHDPAVVGEFTRRFLPVGERRTSAYAQWRHYGNDFLRIVDYETLGLQEDYRLGYDVVVRAYPVVKSFGSTRDFVGVRAGALYTVALGDGFVRALVDTVTESEKTRIADASITTELRVVSPRTPLGRLIFDIDLVQRWRNYLNRLTLLGGEDRLRGWPTRYFVGEDMFSMNLEFRTRPINLFSVLCGGAFFYDVGRAYTGRLDEVSPVQSVGGGFRIVLPQIDRSVIRGDFGFPIVNGALPAGVQPMSFFFAFGQAFRSKGMPYPFGP
ncbi:MAG: hypothetical protein KIT84_44510 [Labilithrix sp.]|nr:hypothetical protein [Labilithrix sp.]MCW5818143.1 hypothetical protein [Labilithrix sp.]